MVTNARGVIARERGAPVAGEDIVVPPPGPGGGAGRRGARGRAPPGAVKALVPPAPGPGEAVVRIEACGVCHTDLHYREGAINDDFPFLLGHEAAGVVEGLGDDGAG